MRINGHGHILPEPFQIPNFMKEKKLFWIDEDKKFMRQGDWSRPITGRGFFIKEKLDWSPSITLKQGLEKTYKWIYDDILKKDNISKFTKY